jgi:hypothetical protein
MQYRKKKIDYTVPSGHEGGPGVGKQMTPYVGTPYVNMTAAQWLAVFQNIGASLGDTWTLGGDARALGGNTFMFVRSKTALTIGQLVASRTPTQEVDDNGGAASTVVTGAGSAASPTTTTAVVTTNIDNTSFPVPATVNDEIDNWLWINSVAGNAAAIPQLRRIKANSLSATSFYTVSQRDYMRPNSPLDQDVFDYTPLNTELCSIIRPYHVQAAANTDTPIGVSLGTVTAGNYTIIQIAGLASVLVDGNGLNEGLVVNQPAWTGAAGAIRGANGVAALLTGAGCVLPQFASIVDVAAGLRIPCYVNFMAQ